MASAKGGSGEVHDPTKHATSGLASATPPPAPTPCRAPVQHPAAGLLQAPVLAPTNSCLLLTVLLRSVLHLLVHRFPHELPRGGGSCLLGRLPLAAGQQAARSDGPQQAAWGRGKGVALVPWERKEGGLLQGKQPMAPAP